MELNLRSMNEQVIESTCEETKFKLDDDASSMVFQIFTKNVYSNPIGSIVREIISNCFDSHVEAKVASNVPVIIRKWHDKLTNSSYISFIDFGMGISPDRMKNVYGVYFRSTKRVDNEQIGGFGIGGKTPLAYKRSTGLGEAEYDNSFNVVTNYNGIKYTYLVYEGAESPTFSLQCEELTDEQNGTEIRIQVLERDMEKFRREMVRQLYYFENVVFEGFENDSTLSNNYQIVRGDSFLYRGNAYSDAIHVCLGRVAYPLSYDNLGLYASDYKFPVAIRLEVGDINVTVSRESLDYSEKTIKMLKTKLNEVKAELTAMLAKQYENIVTLKDYFQVKNDFGWLFFPNGDKINVGEIIKLKDLDFSNFKYSFLKMPTDKLLFKFFFDTKLHFKKETRNRRKRWSEPEETNNFKGSFDDITINTKKRALYYVDGDFERKIIKQAYLKSIHLRYYVISKRNLLDKAYSYGAICDLFNVVDNVVEADGISPTTYMQSILEMQEEFMQIVRDHCTDYKALEVPESFIESRKRDKVTADMRNSQISAKFGNRGGRYKIKLNTLFNVNFAIYYGSTEDEYGVNEASRMYDLLFGSDDNICHYYEHSNTFRTNSRKGIIFLTLSKANLKYMEFCRNAHPVAEFKTRMIKRKEKDVMEFFQAQKFINEYNKLHSFYTAPEFEKLNPVWVNKIAEVRKFIQTTKVDNKHYWDRYVYEFSKYYNIKDIVLTPEQEQYKKTIEEGLLMQELNSEVMNYINLPHYLGETKESFWNTMRKILVF